MHTGAKQTGFACQPQPNLPFFTSNLFQYVRTHSRYDLFGSLNAQSGKGDELAAILVEASQLVATAPSCRIYLVSRDPQDETVGWISEVWDTEQDHDSSLHVAGVRELISRALPLLAGPPEKGRVLQVLGGKGLD